MFADRHSAFVARYYIDPRQLRPPHVFPFFSIFRSAVVGHAAEVFTRPRQLLLN